MIYIETELIEDKVKRLNYEELVSLRDEKIEHMKNYEKLEYQDSDFNLRDARTLYEIYLHDLKVITDEMEVKYEHLYGSEIGFLSFENDFWNNHAGVFFHVFKTGRSIYKAKCKKCNDIIIGETGGKNTECSCGNIRFERVTLEEGDKRSIIPGDKWCLKGPGIMNHSYSYGRGEGVFLKN